MWARTLAVLCIILLRVIVVGSVSERVGEVNVGLDVEADSILVVDTDGIDSQAERSRLGIRLELRQRFQLIIRRAGRERS